MVKNYNNYNYAQNSVNTSVNKTDCLAKTNSFSTEKHFGNPSLPLKTLCKPASEHAEAWLSLSQ